MAEVNLVVEGMHCGACIRRVTQTIAGAGPYTVEEVRLGAARFVAESPAAAIDVVIAALSRAGFTAHAEA